MKRYKIEAIASGIIAAMLIIGGIANLVDGFDAGIIVVLVLAAGLTAATVYLIIKYSKTRDEIQPRNEAPQSEADTRTQSVASEVATDTQKQSRGLLKAEINGILISGMDLPQNIAIKARLYKDTVLFKAGKNKYELAVEKIQKAFVLTGLEVQQIIKQSAPGMVIGAAAFGILGAMVGGRVKTKEQLKTSYLLCINYNSNGEEQQIILDVGFQKGGANDFARRISKANGISNDPIQL